MDNSMSVSNINLVSVVSLMACMHACTQAGMHARTHIHTFTKRTKRYYTRKAGQGVRAVVKDVAPYETGPLFHALSSSHMLHRQLSSDKDSDEETIDKTLMEALSECYQAASGWEMHSLILSIMADKVRYSKPLQYIPGLTNYSQKPNAIA